MAWQVADDNDDDKINRTEDIYVFSGDKRVKIKHNIINKLKEINGSSFIL